MLLKEKVAIITGAASGIGREATLLFTDEGAKVIVADMNEEQGHQVVSEVKARGNEAIFVKTDVRSVSDLERMIKMAVQTYGKLDVFWHNAGIAGPGVIERTTEEEYEKTMAIHLKAGVFGSKFAISEMRKAGGGCILFTSSISGLMPSPFSITYSLAKAGLVMLTKDLALAYGKENIRVNCICPAPVQTPLLEAIRVRQALSQEEMDKTSLPRIPMGRYVKKEEVAQAALFLISDKASAITGVALSVDCGMAIV